MRETLPGSSSSSIGDIGNRGKRIFDDIGLENEVNIVELKRIPYLNHDDSYNVAVPWSVVGVYWKVPLKSCVVSSCGPKSAND